MAKKVQPGYREARGGWYAVVNGQRHSLGPPERAPPAKEGKRGWNSPPGIDEAYRRLPATGSPESSPRAARRWRRCWTTG